MTSARLQAETPSDVDETSDVVELRSQRGSPTWEIAHLYPNQGDWSEGEYLALESNRLVEFNNGSLEFLPMPDFWHQWIVQLFFRELDNHVRNRGLAAYAMVAPFRIRLRPNLIREPDVVLVPRSKMRGLNTPPLGADLVMEVVSPGAESRTRDLETKREEYAAAGIPEYWIIDPEQQRVLVLALEETAYVVHGEFTPGSQASSRLLAEFSVDVTPLLIPPEVEDNNQEEPRS